MPVLLGALKVWVYRIGLSSDSRLLFGRAALPCPPDPDALTDEQWARLAPLMPGGRKGKRGPRTNNRLFLDALI